MFRAMDENQCETCFRFYTGKSSLDRHIKARHQNYKPHKCDTCGKCFNRKQNRDLHCRRCPPAKVGGAVSKRFTKTLMENLDLTPIKGKTAFGGCFADWSIVFPRRCEYIHPEILLEEATKAMKATIQEHLRTHTPRLKFTMSIFAILQQACDPEVKTDPPICLTSSPYNVYKHRPIVDKEHHMLEEALHDTAVELGEMLENYEGMGSGWVMDRLIRLDTSLTSCKFP